MFYDLIKAQQLEMFGAKNTGTSAPRTGGRKKAAHPGQQDLFGAKVKPKRHRGGPYIGPRGGKWADPQHTKAWKEDANTNVTAPTHAAAHAKPVKHKHGVKRGAAQSTRDKAKGLLASLLQGGKLTDRQWQDQSTPLAHYVPVDRLEHVSDEQLRHLRNGAKHGAAYSAALETELRRRHALKFSPPTEKSAPPTPTTPAEEDLDWSMGVNPNPAPVAAPAESEPGWDRFKDTDEKPAPPFSEGSRVVYNGISGRWKGEILSADEHYFKIKKDDGTTTSVPRSFFQDDSTTDYSRGYPEPAQTPEQIAASKVAATSQRAQDDAREAAKAAEKKAKFEGFTAPQDRREMTKRVKAELKRLYPGHKFSVRGSTGTAYNWIKVSGRTPEAEQKLREHIDAHNWRLGSIAPDGWNAVLNHLEKLPTPGGKPAGGARPTERHLYGMQARPADWPGSTHPEGGEKVTDEDREIGGKYVDYVSYDRELTPDELRRFHMERVVDPVPEPVAPPAPEPAPAAHAIGDVLAFDFTGKRGNVRERSGSVRRMKVTDGVRLYQVAPSDGGRRLWFSEADLRKPGEPAPAAPKAESKPSEPGWDRFKDADKPARGPAPRTPAETRAEIAQIKLDMTYGYGENTPRPKSWAPMAVKEPARHQLLVEKIQALEEQIGSRPWQRQRDAIQRITGMPPERHRRYVLDALKAGKDVPVAVLADYPGIEQEAHGANLPVPTTTAREKAAQMLERRRLYKKTWKEAEAFRQRVRAEMPDGDDIDDAFGRGPKNKLLSELAEMQRTMHHKDAKSGNVDVGHVMAAVHRVRELIDAGIPAPGRDSATTLPPRVRPTMTLRDATAAGPHERTPRVMDALQLTHTPADLAAVKESHGGARGMNWRMAVTQGEAKLAKLREEITDHTHKALHLRDAADSRGNGGARERETRRAEVEENQRDAKARESREASAWLEIARGKAAAMDRKNAKAKPSKPFSTMLEGIVEPGKPRARPDYSRPDLKPADLEHPLLSAKADDLSYDTAKTAHSGTSYSPEKRARQHQTDYINAMRNMADSVQKWVTDDNRGAIKSELVDFQRGYLKRHHAWLAAKSGTLSPMITGPSKFPTRRNEKRLDTEHKRLTEFVDWQKGQLGKLAKKYDPAVIARAPIRADAGKPEAISALEAKIADAEKTQAAMKARNRIARSKKLTAEQKIDKLVDMGMSRRHADALMEPNYMGKVGYEGWQLSNNNANTKRMKARIVELQREHERSQAAPEGGAEPFAFDGGTVEEDHDDNRVRIYFNDKPDKDMRTKLKRHGFKWSPNAGAWQRQNNERGRYAVNSVLGVTFAKARSTPLFGGIVGRATLHRPAFSDILTA
jgi:hypothetical protein